MMKLFITCVSILFVQPIFAQSKIDSFRMYNVVRITLDIPQYKNNAQQPVGKTIIILFALPNGNTTEQTMGKKLLLPTDDWHLIFNT